MPLRKRERMMQGFRSAGRPEAVNLGLFSRLGTCWLTLNLHQSALPTHLHRLRAMTAWKAAAGVLA